MSAVQRNGNVEIGTVDPDFELAVPPLQAGEKFADVYEVICILDNREKFRTGSGKAAYVPNLAISAWCIWRWQLGGLSSRTPGNV